MRLGSSLLSWIAHNHNENKQHSLTLLELIIFHQYKYTVFLHHRYHPSNVGQRLPTYAAKTLLSFAIIE